MIGSRSESRKRKMRKMRKRKKMKRKIEKRKKDVVNPSKTTPFSSVGMISTGCYRYRQMLNNKGIFIGIKLPVFTNLEIPWPNELNGRGQWFTQLFSFLGRGSRWILHGGCAGVP